LVVGGPALSGWQGARVARKLATILHRMWVDGATFRFGGEKAADAVTLKMIAATV
jgi:hypothetical protein